MNTKWGDLRKKKQILLEDLNACVAYTPNREADLIAFMSQYIKAKENIRPRLLEDIRACMDGWEYPNPYEKYEQFSAADIEQFSLILDGFLDGLSGTNQPDLIVTVVGETVQKLNHLNGRTGLIDSWRREKLCEIINQAAALAGTHTSDDIT